MALVIKDRVKEQTTTTGTGSVTLTGAVAGFESFSAVGDGNTTYYAIVHQSLSEWEVGLGTYTASGTTLSRDTVLDSSNSGSAVNFSAGVKDVFVTYAADKAVYRDASGDVSVTFATSAANATTAVSATNATSATFATSATNATTAITATSATNATSATFATSATNATTAISVDGGTVSATDGTFNTMTVVTSASVGGGLNVGGNVGIGTTSPSTIFHIDDNVTAGSGFLITGGGGGFPLAKFQRDIGGASLASDITINCAHGNPQIRFTESTGSVYTLGQDTTLFKISKDNILGTNDLFVIGNDTVAVGQSTLQALTTGTNNTAVGQNGLTSTTTGTQNTSLGYNAGNTTTTGSNNTFIGYDAEGSSATVSNEITLGNTAVTKFRIPGIDFVLKDNGGTPTTGQVLTADGSGEGYWATPATSVTNATNAVSATFATSATNATTAITATSATNATNAVSATFAASATNATTAVSATNATSATFATNATNLDGGTVSATSGTFNTLIASGLTYPSTDGTASQIIQTNGSGTLSFVSVSGGATDIDGLSDAITNSSGQTVGLGTGALANDDGTTNRNTALGYNALNAVTSGFGNIGIGYQAGDAVTTTSYNTAIGYDAGTATTSAESVFVGSFAGYHNNANYNVFIGHDAARGNNVTCTGSGSVAIGHDALYSFSTGTNNNVIGQYGLGLLTTGSNNNALGYRSGYNITTGQSNVLVGSEAGENISTGSYNVFIGQEAGESQIGNKLTGNDNVGIGRLALTAMRGANKRNTAVGAYALQGSFDADDNTAVGYGAGSSISTGDNNTCIGYDAEPSSGTASNEVTLGNASITSLRCNQTTISSLSDRRDKTNIEDLTIGLNFINDLRPVKFRWDRRDGTMSGVSDAGFIAQELDDVQTKYEAEDYLRMVLKTNPEKLEAAPGKLIPILVKAIQELSSEISDLKEQINGN